MKSLNKENDREFGIEFLKLGLLIGFLLLLAVGGGYLIAFNWI